MPKYNTIEVYTILAAGATKSFDIADNIDIYEIDADGGAVALAGNMVFNSTGTAKKGMLFTFHYGGGVTIGGNTLSFFGVNLTAAQALGEMLITAYYNGSTWEVKLFADVTSGLAEISGNNIVDDTITTAKISNSQITLAKNAALSARGYMVRGTVNGAYQEFDAKTSGNILIGNGTDITSTAVTGDVTINGSGVTAIGAGKVTPTMLSFSILSYLEVTRTLTSAEILALRTTPIDIIAAPGANKYLEIISASACLNYGTTTYNAGTDLLNLEVNGVALWAFSNAFVESTSDTATQGAHQTYPLTAINSGLKARMSSADPTTGDSTITIHVIYSIRDAV